MLLQRIITAVVLILVLLAVLLLAPPFATIILLVLVVLAGAWEWSAFVRPRASWQRVLYVAFIAALLWFGWQLRDEPEVRRVVLVGAALWWLLALLWLALLPRAINRLTATLAGILVLVPTFMALVQLRLDFPHGAELTLFVLVLVWAADTGAFAAGKRFGKHRLAPQVSPGKTWEGLAGGLLLAMVAALLGAGWFDLPRVHFVLLCLLVAVASVIGDLTESMFKRYAGLKDSGALIPGHGGMMDRLDSITAAVPVFVLGLQMLERTGALS